MTGETTKIRENGATSGAGVLATFAYDNLGRRASLTRGDGSVLSYSYDNVSRLTQLSDNLAGTAYDQTLGFSYNPASQIASNSRSNDAYAWTGHYNVNRAYTSNGLNQYTASGPITPTYDTKGNLTSAGSATYAYSSENLLTSASGGIALAYDPAMRLYQTSGGSDGTTRFAYDGTNLIAEYNGSNALLRRYVHGPGTDEPLVWYEGSGTSDRRFLHADERGSVVAVTNSAGTTLNVNGYNEYGIPSSGNVGRFQYTGQTWLPELGMYYYKARIYSPTLGRFLQTDPIGYGDGMNLYAYVGGDPVNLFDPTGLCEASRINVAPGSICNGSALQTVEVSGGAVGPSDGKAKKKKKGDLDIPAGQGDGFETRDEAAKAFYDANSEKYKKLPPGREILGLVVQMDNGNFKYTSSVTVPADNFKVTLKYNGNNIAYTSAAAHTHPSTSGYGYSIADINFVKKSGLPFYLRQGQSLRLLTVLAAAKASEGFEGINACPPLAGKFLEKCF